MHDKERLRPTGSGRCTRVLGYAWGIPAREDLHRFRTCEIFQREHVRVVDLVINYTFRLHDHQRSCCEEDQGVEQHGEVIAAFSSHDAALLQFSALRSIIRLYWADLLSNIILKSKLLSLILL